MQMFMPILLGILTTALSVSAAEVNEYVLQAGDVIEISVVEHPEFSGRHKIRPDGRINYPVIGEVDVSGQTCPQLVKLMQGKLSAYVNNPAVSISIESYYANKVYVIGGVRKAGEYQIFEPIDVLRALAMCGGLSQPRVKRIKIVRADGNVVTISMRDFWGDDVKRDNSRWVLYPGDTLYVPERGQVPWAMIATILGLINLTLIIILNTNSVSSL
jgi:polysaccharide biosynthesis/export protein